MKSRILMVLLAAGVAAGAQAPVNDNCNLVFGLVAGVNPQPPAGNSGTTYTNVGATNTAAPAPLGCAPFNKDVWFSYTATVTGLVQFSTCTPPGFAAGTLTDTTIAVYDTFSCGTTATPLACNDDNCGFGSLRSSTSAVVTATHLYLVRVGSFSATASGTFYVTVTEPAVSPAAQCSTAPNAVVGALTNASLNGCHLTSSIPPTPPCALSYSVAHWVKYVSGSFVGSQQLEVEATGGAVDHVYVYSGPCGALSALACIGKRQEVSIAPSTTYWIRFEKASDLYPLATLDFQYILNVAPSPPNDDCFAAFSVTNGVYPRNPGDAPYFTNVGAFGTPGSPTCNILDKNDVYFSYLATTSGKVVVSTQTPPGKIPGTLIDPVLYVMSSCGGSVLACNDDVVPGSNFQAELEFDAVQGQNYVIRLATAGVGPPEGTFHLTIRPKFAIKMSSPTGLGSFRLVNEFGAANHFVYNCLTLQQGSYPTGPFFGIEPTLTEISLQIAYGQAPFVVPLNGAGGYLYDHVGFLPPLTVYGVAIQFDPLGQVAGVSAPTAHQIF